MLFFWLVTQSSPTRRNACWKPKNVPWEAIRQRADVVFSCTRKEQTSSRRIGSMRWVAANFVWSLILMQHIVLNLSEPCFHSYLPCMVENGEPKQRRWWLQRERQKSNRFRLVKQQLCTCITLFIHFLPSLLDYDVKILWRTRTQDDEWAVAFYIRCPTPLPSWGTMEFFRFKL